MQKRLPTAKFENKQVKTWDESLLYTWYIYRNIVYSQ